MKSSLVPPAGFSRFLLLLVAAYGLLRVLQ
jgi:hypothetical protein